MLVSFFVRSEDRFFVPTRGGSGTPRAAAVEAGRRYALAAISAVAKPRLDDGEHDIRLRLIGTKASSETWQAGGGCSTVAGGNDRPVCHCRL